MNAELLLRAIGDVEEAYVLNAGKPVPKRKISRPLRLLLIAAVIMALFLCSVGAVYVLRHWNTLLETHFTPTEPVLEQLSSGIEEPNAQFFRNGVTLSVTQTLCDGDTFYALLAVQLPDTIDITKLQAEEADASGYGVYEDEVTGQPFYGLSTDKIFWFQGDIPDETLEALSVDSFWADSQGLLSMFTLGVCSPIRLDVENRTMYYLLHTILPEAKAQEPFVVWFENITSDKTGEALVNGPFYVRWTPNATTGQQHSVELCRDGETIAALTVSSLSLHIEIPDLADTMDTVPDTFDTTRWNELDDYLSVSLTMTDGTVYSLNGAYTWQQDPETGVISVTVDANLYTQVGTLIDLNSILSVTVNDLKFSLQE